MLAKNLIKYYIILLMIMATLSCSKNESFFYEVIEPETVTGLSLYSSYLTNQNISFEVFDSIGDNITHISSFVVDGNTIESNTISYENLGDHNVYAEYTLNNQLYNTEIKNFSIVNPINKLLIEDYTGTWCGYCPPVSHAIELARESFENIVVVATHENDEFTINGQVDLFDEIGVGGLPEARLNRTIEWMNPYDLSEIKTILLNDNSIAISIDTNIDNFNLNINTRIVSNGNLQNSKILVYLVENNILADQANYLNFDESSYFYNMGNPITNFVHNDVLRHSFTNITGDIIPIIESLEDYNLYYSIELDENYIIENMGVVVSILDNENTALNSQYVEVGQFQDFN
tara:strand:- start:272 stop:1309 length:1038 start_codon:yes stop_codon:yes gene_type:complete